MLVLPRPLLFLLLVWCSTSLGDAFSVASSWNRPVPRGSCFLLKAGEGPSPKPGVRVKLGRSGTELWVAKKRRKRHSSSTTTATRKKASASERYPNALSTKDGASTHHELKETRAHKVVSPLEEFIRTPSGAALGVAAGFICFKKMTTGSFIEWGVSSYDRPEDRRCAVQSEDDLKKLNILCCETCGYTVFAAMGRTFRAKGVNDKVCPNCGAEDSFYDKNDPSDSRNVKADGTNVALETQDYAKKWILADSSAAQELTKEFRAQAEKLQKKGSLPKNLAKDIVDLDEELHEERFAQGDNEEHTGEDCEEGGGVGWSKEDDLI